MTSEDSTITAPIDRSIPAVRMISVWPTASDPMTAVCCSRIDRFSALKNRSLTIPKTMHANINTISGLSHGSRCRIS